MSKKQHSDIEIVTFGQFRSQAEREKYDLKNLLKLDFGDDGDPNENRWDKEAGRKLRRDYIDRLNSKRFAASPVVYKPLLKLYLLWTRPQSYYACFPNERPTTGNGCEYCQRPLGLTNSSRRFCTDRCRKKAARARRTVEGSRRGPSRPSKPLETKDLSRTPMG